MAAPKGNQYASKTQRLWSDSIKRHFAQNPDKMAKIVSVVADAALAGESWAVTELANRLDGKPVQQVEMTGDFTNRLAHELSLSELQAIAAGRDPTTDKGETVQ
jgi:hypothetical protein